MNLPAADMPRPASGRWRVEPESRPKRLYRLIPNKAALFERMASDRLDRFLSDVNLQAVDHADIDEALYEAPLDADIARSNPKARRAFAKSSNG